ncbi:esterase [Maribacter algarum]|uniref:Esterase n=1 Tax=Maribacter algarum (ex Zhang et al. 2020) TaxID=2578118 RepID=A0A5S3PQF8_9FLAO|nr:esterase [Maribacter algarum]TMM56977.1 esterase [Maribacter algarum]
MNKHEKQVTYQTTNTYETLNRFTKKTKNIWVVLHGIGYLSKYFIRYFDELNPDENYIIAPQAPAKYYLKNEYKYVGASWLTKENRVLETNNVLAYLDAVYAAEEFPADCNLIIFGFSQGVSIATRWIASRKIQCSKMILYAGGIPKELTPENFTFLNYQETGVTVIVGDKDQYLTGEVMKYETARIKELFRGKAKQKIFKGGHEVKKEIINEIV